MVRLQAETAQFALRAPYPLDGAQRRHDDSCGIRLQRGFIDADNLEIDAVQLQPIAYSRLGVVPEESVSQAVGNDAHLALHPYVEVVDVATFHDIRVGSHSIAGRIAVDHRIGIFLAAARLYRVAHHGNDLHHGIAEHAVQGGGIRFVEPDGPPLALSLEGL